MALKWVSLCSHNTITGFSVGYHPVILCIVLCHLSFGWHHQGYKAFLPHFLAWACIESFPWNPKMILSGCKVVVLCILTLYVFFVLLCFVIWLCFCTLKVEVPSTDYKGLQKVSLISPRGQGVVYNVLVHDPSNKLQAVYSPTVSYGCDLNGKVLGCDTIGECVLQGRLF